MTSFVLRVSKELGDFRSVNEHDLVRSMDAERMALQDAEMRALQDPERLIRQDDERIDDERINLQEGIKENDNPAIVILVGNRADDWRDLQVAIKSMDHHLVDRQTSDLLLFHEEGTIPANVTVQVKNWTRRPLFWHAVNFYFLPSRIQS